MKKIVKNILIIVFLLILCSCKNTTTEEINTSLNELETNL